MRTWAVFSLIFCSCCTSKNSCQSISSVFTTYVPGYIEQVNLERKFDGRIYPLPAVMIYLRQDGSYVFGYCDNQISEAGRYSIKGDSILLYRRTNFDERMYNKRAFLFYDKKHDLLYLISDATNLRDTRLHRLIMGKASNQVIPFKRNGTVHYGFLRGQEMDLDSLIHSYKQRTTEEQNEWTDSVMQSFNAQRS